ncbi:protein of unknown function [Azospirillum baldaniorum]|uniref:Uncharacterized protein n=1 Tax=Azospirillum baldaniorum TaxID=1064539 RepID=A0A9P1JMU5_9PROT|nr:protein of unknown function [Azospirillum baldaniorum]
MSQPSASHGEPAVTDRRIIGPEGACPFGLRSTGHEQPETRPPRREGRDVWPTSTIPRLSARI